MNKLKIKLKYRDYISFGIAFFLGMWFYPELSIYNIKYYGISIFIGILWYLGATRDTPNPWRKK